MTPRERAEKAVHEYVNRFQTHPIQVFKFVDIIERAITEAVEAEVAQLEKENKRYREALEKIAAYPCDAYTLKDPAKIAKQALGDK